MIKSEEHKSEINHFFELIHTKKTSMQYFKELYDPLYSHDFNIFSFIRPNENRLSEIIGFLLNTEAEHGQGSAFLNIFLNDIKKAINEKGNNGNTLFDNVKNNSSKSVVKLEDQTDSINNSNRRIDITLNIGDFCLGIENKPWCYDAQDQIKDYCEHLYKSSDNYCMVYLSGNGEPPAEESIKEEKRKDLEKKSLFITYSYSELADSICRFKSVCQSERMRFFLNDFEWYLKKEFKGEREMFEKDIIVECAIDNPKNLETALSVANSKIDIQIKLMEKFSSELAQHLPTGLNLKWDFEYWNKYTGFSFSKDEWENCMIRFEFDQIKVNSLIYGVKTEEETNMELPVLHKSEKLGSAKTSSWWPWYKHFETPYLNWQDHTEPWTDLLEKVTDKGHSKMTDIIFTKVNEISIALDEVFSVK